ncbi:MAG: hypothetical protein NTY19_41945 [Planctomycetota bacterium]|nr:hypothetical protein [Planctomycetota bacterium]
MKHTFILLTALLLASLAALHGAEVPQTSPTHRVLFRQPELAGVGNRMYVQARVPSGEFAMVGWQKSPFTPDGKFLPVGWDAGAKTGLAVTGDRTLAQRGMRDVAGATTAQMSGDAVGVYLNSADLSGSGTDAQGRPLPGSGGFKMMVTPQIRFAPESAVRPFRAENGRLDLSLDLQVPVAECGEKKGSLAYDALQLESDNFDNPQFKKVDVIKVRVGIAALAVGQPGNTIRALNCWDQPPIKASKPCPGSRNQNHATCNAAACTTLSGRFRRFCGTFCRPSPTSRPSWTKCWRAIGCGPTSPHGCWTKSGS